LVRAGKVRQSWRKISEINGWRGLRHAGRLGRNRLPTQAIYGSRNVPRILVVDDEPLISMLIEDWLNELGCEVVGPARCVADGLDLVERAELDAAILDVNLAGESSLSLANALKLKGVPVAFATGDSGIDENSGFADPILLNKPFMFEDVKAVVGKLLKPAV
jgi:DNA-binding response OmpR family regulator